MKLIKIISLIVVLLVPVGISYLSIYNTDNDKKIVLNEVEEEESDDLAEENFQIQEYIDSKENFNQQLYFALEKAQRLFKIEASIYEGIKLETATPPPEIS